MIANSTSRSIPSTPRGCASFSMRHRTVRRQFTSRNWIGRETSPAVSGIVAFQRRSSNRRLITPTRSMGPVIRSTATDLIRTKYYSIPTRGPCIFRLGSADRRPVIQARIRARPHWASFSRRSGGLTGVVTRFCGTRTMQSSTNCMCAASPSGPIPVSHQRCAAHSLASSRRSPT